MQISICSKAPNFKAAAVMANGEINENFQLSNYNGKYILLFFYPLDFTFVCPSEIIAHHNRIKAFEERQTQVIGISIDSQFTHHAWRNTPRENGGIGPIGFPLVADINHEIVNAYGISHPDGVALRATFLIDQSGIIQHSTVNNLPLGRNVDEALRIIDALQFSEKYGEVCPAGWEKGDKGMKATKEGVSEYLGNNSTKL